MPSIINRPRTIRLSSVPVKNANATNQNGSRPKLRAYAPRNRTARVSIIVDIVSCLCDLPTRALQKRNQQTEASGPNRSIMATLPTTMTNQLRRSISKPEKSKTSRRTIQYRRHCCCYHSSPYLAFNASISSCVLMPSSTKYSCQGTCLPSFQKPHSRTCLPCANSVTTRLRFSAATV